MTTMTFKQVTLSGQLWVELPEWKTNRHWPNVPRVCDQVRLPNEYDTRSVMMPACLYTVQAIEWQPDGSVEVKVRAILPYGGAVNL